MASNRSFTLVLHTLAAVVAAILLAGCTDPGLQLSYDPVCKVKVPALTEVALTVNDTRENKITIGERRNGLNVKTWDIRLASEQAASEWVSRAITAELTKAGCRVTPAPQAGNSPLVKGTVTEFLATQAMIPGLTVIGSNIKVNITVTRGTSTLLSRQYEGKSVASTTFASSFEHEQLAKGALQDLLKKAMPDVVAALK